MNEKGFVHLYFGDGKGKTSAAAGLAMRVLGVGGTVLFVQFLKGKPSGEVGMLEQLGAKVVRTPSTQKFWFQMNDEEKACCQAENQLCFDLALEAMASGRHDLVVLDEVVDALNCGILDTDTLAAALAGRKAGVEVALTGHNPSPAVLEMADYISEVKCLRHPYATCGQPARRGIEY